VRGRDQRDKEMKIFFAGSEELETNGTLGEGDENKMVDCASE
jgi:hypothetical protein